MARSEGAVYYTPWSLTRIDALEVSMPIHAAIMLAPRLVVPLEAHPLAALAADLANVAHSGALTADLQPLVDVEGLLLHRPDAMFNGSICLCVFQRPQGTSSISGTA